MLFFLLYIKQKIRINNQHIVNFEVKMFKLWQLLFLLILVGCSSNEVQLVPAIVPNTAKEVEVVVVRPNNIIGEVEPIYLLPMKTPFMARIDTGATTSSLDAENVKMFERDGDKWVAFTIVNRTSGERYSFEKPIEKHTYIKRIGDRERRPHVEMAVKFGKDVFKADFTLAERDKFDYQVLIGRNIIAGRAVVDVTLSNTLK